MTLPRAKEARGVINSHRHWLLKMNNLHQLNKARSCHVQAIRDRHIAARRNRPTPKLLDYPLPQLKARIADALSVRWGHGPLDLRIEAIDRVMFGADLVVKIPQLLVDGGPKAFIQKHVPWVTDVLRSAAFADVIADVQVKGMYVNLRLNERWLLDSAQAAIDLGINFGRSDAEAGRTFLMDYSSPNVAKVLHAGHIRSTIIGHVLGNLHEACGALVYRVNHINDFGGFGFMLEGYRRFQNLFPPEMRDNERLLEIYRIRRVLERVAGVTTPGEIDSPDRETLGRYFPEATSLADYEKERIAFVAASDARFAALTAGDSEEVGLWTQMVEWSLRDFQQFYDSLDIHIELVMGESFYVQAGNDVVDRGLAEGSIVHYTEASAAKDTANVNAALAAKTITEADHREAIEAIQKDLGAVVVRFEGGERFVVRRSDGHSIYATRDLGAISLRCALFSPTDIIYVVGQEQRVHFSRLFKAAEAIGIARREQLRLQHVHFGFYVDAETGRKLSSRDSVANVNQLLAASVEHFRSKSAERGNISADELASTAHHLAVSSVVFNDLKQEIKGAVEIDTKNPQATIEGFEKSGGAYVVYSACRARSILRKHGSVALRAQELATVQLDQEETQLLVLILEIPDLVVAAAAQSNPTLLIRHLLDLATLYNAWYVKAKVITAEGTNFTRLLITRAVAQALESTLAICHIKCPPRI